MLARIIAARPAASALINSIHRTTACEQVKQRSLLHTSVQNGIPAKGEIYQKQPVKMIMEKGKTYNWCACGLSKKQPLCDGSHKNSPRGLTPITFKPDTTKEYFLCNCKQTDQRPFCDGSHKK